MATGRKTVVVGQVIDPVAWGNPLWDQSVQQFASDADRTAQFPAGQRKPGAVTWLDDVKQWQGWDGVGWVVLNTDLQGLTVTDTTPRTGAVGNAVKSLAAIANLTAGLWRVQGGAGISCDGVRGHVALTLFNQTTALELAGNPRGTPVYIDNTVIATLLTRPLYVSVPVGQTVPAQVVGVPANVGSTLTMNPGAAGPGAWIEALRMRPTP